MRRLWNKAKSIIRNICFVDCFLIIFMLVLFSYMVVHLCIGMDSGQDTSTVNVIVRTSIASIFGYFISSNFSRADLSANPQNTDNHSINLPAKSVIESPESRVQNQIGFQASAKPSNEEVGNISFSENSSVPIRMCSKTQIIVVSTIGLISLVILFITSRFQNVTPELTATISQLRDFVSACIGFLVSCGRNTT